MKEIEELFKDYIHGRDPVYANITKDREEDIMRSLKILRNLPDHEFKDMIRCLACAALESYLSCDSEPLNDMVGGWIATAEVYKRKAT